jgi:hypothetical protein
LPSNPPSGRFRSKVSIPPLSGRNRSTNTAATVSAFFLFLPGQSLEALGATAGPLDFERFVSGVDQGLPNGVGIRRIVLNQKMFSGIEPPARIAVGERLEQAFFPAICSIAYR